MAGPGRWPLTSSGRFCRTIEPAVRTNVERCSSPSAAPAVPSRPIAAIVETSVRLLMGPPAAACPGGLPAGFGTVRPDACLRLRVLGRQTCKPDCRFVTLVVYMKVTPQAEACGGSLVEVRDAAGAVRPLPRRVRPVHPAGLRVQRGW